MNGYIITHIGEGEFEVTFPEGDKKSAGPNLCGMIRYTYFEDFTLPVIGWSVTNSQLIKDYQPKVWADIQSGKIKLQQCKTN